MWTTTTTTSQNKNSTPEVKIIKNNLLDLTEKLKQEH